MVQRLVAHETALRIHGVDTWAAMIAVVASQNTLRLQTVFTSKQGLVLLCILGDHNNSKHLGIHASCMQPVLLLAYMQEVELEHVCILVGGHHSGGSSKGVC